MIKFNLFKNTSTIDNMVKEFIKVFPNKCMICSYWRYGRENGMTDKSTPKHQCIEN
jgi:hypothetical protein